MPRKPVPELTRKAIIKSRKGGVSVADLAAQHNLSTRTIQRITKGVDPEINKPAVEVVASAVAMGSTVIVDGIDLTEHLLSDIDRLSAAMAEAEPKSFEGVAGVKLRYLEYYSKLRPPTLEDFVDQLLARPDFSPEKFIALLKERYAAKAS
jgi:hypothetical protein